MNWGIVTEDWRLKLLGLGLAVLMLGAVAFSQNPPTSGNIQVPLNYNVGPDIVILNPPTKVTVSYSGLADAVGKVNVYNVTATADASKARPGNAVALNVRAATTLQDLRVINPAAIVVNIDARATVELPVTVSAHAAPGWAITKEVAICPGTTQANACVVRFDGPKSWENNLQAVVQFPGIVGVSSIDSPNQPIQLSNSNGFVDLTPGHTQPDALLDINSVSVHIEAVAGSTSSTVTLLDSAPSHGPASGYRITAVTITPNVVTVTGDPGTLAKCRSITLPPVDLSGRTSDYQAQVAIPYQNCGDVSGSVANATVKYSIAPNPNVSPAP